MLVTNDEIKEGNQLIANFMGYKYFEYGILLDDGTVGGIYDLVDVYSKTPILVNKYEDGEKYFAEVPNPDYQNHKNPKWNSNYKTLSWSTLNEYLTNLEYHSSWDWIMPVINKINGLGKEYSLAIFKNYISCTVEKSGKFYKDFSYTHAEYITSEQSGNIAAFRLLIHFISWYNKNIKDAEVKQ